MELTAEDFDIYERLADTVYAPIRTAYKAADRADAATMSMAASLRDQAENGPWDGAEQDAYSKQAKLQLAR